MKTWEMIEKMVEDRRRVFVGKNMHGDSFVAKYVSNYKYKDADGQITVTNLIMATHHNGHDFPLTANFGVSDNGMLFWEWKEVQNDALPKPIPQKVIDFIKYLPEEYEWIAVDSQANGDKNFYAYIEKPYIRERGIFWGSGDFLSLDEFRHILSELNYENSPYYIGDTERV